MKKSFQTHAQVVDKRAASRIKVLKTPIFGACSVSMTMIQRVYSKLSTISSNRHREHP